MIGQETKLATLDAKIASLKQTRKKTVKILADKRNRERRKADAHEKILVGSARIAALGKIDALREAMDHLGDRDRQWIEDRLSPKENPAL